MVTFYKDNATVLSSYSDPNLGGRNLDMTITTHFAKKLGQDANLNISQDADYKNWMRLQKAVKKAREMLSSDN